MVKNRHFHRSFMQSPHVQLECRRPVASLCSSMELPMERHPSRSCGDRMKRLTGELDGAMEKS